MFVTERDTERLKIYVYWTLLITTNSFLEPCQKSKGTEDSHPPAGKAGKQRGGGGGMLGSKCLEKHSGQEMPKILELSSSHWPQSR